MNLRPGKASAAGRSPRLGLAWLALLVCAAPARADDVVTVCFNYGCQSQAAVRYSDTQLDAVRRELAQAGSPAEERAALARVVGHLYRWADAQSPIGADHAGNFNDGAAYGRMDCIDHSTTTTRLLKMLEAHGWLKYHRVLQPARRTRWLISQHFSAVVEEQGGVGSGARFVVDTWFVEHGQPAVVMPLQQWLDGGGPNV